MSLRPNLLQWQYADYHAKHRHSVNLWLHIASVPLAWGGTLAAICVLFGASAWWLLALPAGWLLALVVQGIGHKLEPEAPEPFLGGADFVSRFTVEQLVNFPRFVLGGGWWRGLSGGR